MDKAQSWKNKHPIGPTTFKSMWACYQRAEVHRDCARGSGCKFIEIVDAGAPSDSKFESLHKATYDLVRKALASLQVQDHGMCTWLVIMLAIISG